ncbi:ABC transporter ATP-binding protein [Paeniclostridium sp. NSJ-45]|uniref:ABC transporter ATP-binding protein n=2 Tax=Paeniclostridium hominis TaxID=2764329 RepID=A0ABR7K1R4_9FIRM|nr:ABC transporter ATP-binding protein [Paeniclostridium hominis]
MMSFDEEEYKRSFSINIWKKLNPFLKQYKLHFICAILANLFVAFVDVMFPIFQKYAIDNFITPMSTKGINNFVIVYILAIVLQVIFVIIFTRLSMYLEMNIGKDLKRATFMHLQKLSFSYYNTTPVGYIIARVMSDTNKIGSMVAWGLVDLFWSITYVLGVFIAMFMLNAKLAMYVIAIVPFIAILTVYFQNKILNVNRDVRKINSKITGAFNEGITGSITSKTLVIEDKNLEDFSKITDKMYKTSIRATKLNAIYMPIILFFSSLAVAFVLDRGGNLVINDLMEIGTLSAFISYAISIFEPIQQLAKNISEFIATQANIERVFGLLEKTPDIVDSEEVIKKYGDSFNPKKENWEEIKGDIEFKDVYFKYPDGDEYIYENFNLKIPAGTTLALVGETGSGKSTLVNLACRFFEPTKGKVLIDGKDYRERSQLWLHNNIGYVLQNPHLFSGTIKENIRYGKLDATDEEVENAAKIVSAHKIIMNMEKGYDSQVGEGGSNLSTGEKQLISFARAVLANPRIFVLDEATSSIDTETEQIIQNAISHLLKDRTSFLVAHRLSTIRKADIILVVRDGKIVEKGSHKELLKQKKYYYSLYVKQFEEEVGENIFKGL